MVDRDWLAGWNPRFARLLVAVETPEARAGLVDTNGDGRELWFGLDVRSPSGDWAYVLDWDDVDGHQPLTRAHDRLDVIFGWGTGRPGERKTLDYLGESFGVRVRKNGWWLLVSSAPHGRA
jgi:hypothetical protein